MSRIKRREGLHKEALVLPSSFRFDLGGATRPRLHGKALKEFEEQKRKMTESFLENANEANIENVRRHLLEDSVPDTAFVMQVKDECTDDGDIV